VHGLPSHSIARSSVPNGLQPGTLERVYRLFPRLKERRTNLGAQFDKNIDALRGQESIVHQYPGV